MPADSPHAAAHIVLLYRIGQLAPIKDADDTIVATLLRIRPVGFSGKAGVEQGSEDSPADSEQPLVMWIALDRCHAGGEVFI